MVYCIRIFLMTAVIAGLTSCSWVGETAGKAHAKIERKTQSVESGYHRGYEEEKAKTASREQSETSRSSNVANP